MQPLVRRCIPLAGLLSCTMLCTAAMADTGTATSTSVTMSSYQTALIPLEGGAKGFQASGSGGAYLGAFQLSQAALQDAGWKNADGSWSAKAQAAGVNSNNDFLNNPQAQVSADSAYNAKNLSYMGSGYLGTTDKYTGTTLDSGSLAYCSESLGAGGCKSYLATGVIPDWELAGNPGWKNGGWQKNLAAMSNTSTGDSGTVDVNTTTSNSANGSTSTTTVNGIFCDPAIMKQVQAEGVSMVQAWTTLAERPETGYTLVGGQSVLEAAGLLTSGQQGFVGNTGFFGSAGGTYAQASCLNRLSNSGLNTIFNPPSIGDIIGMLINAACNEATQLFSQVTAPLNQSVYQAFSMNGIVPGLNLGTIGGVASVSVGQSNGGGLLNINGGNNGSYSYTPDAGWYSSNMSRNAATGYGSLFGTGNTAASGPLSGGLY